jgi:hypothetical protein
MLAGRYVALCSAMLAMLAVLLIGTTAPVLAEIRPELRSTATLVVTGVVTAVTTNQKGPIAYHVTSLKLEGITIGPGLKIGDTVRISSFQQTEPLPKGMVGASGHKPPAKVGERIDAFARADRTPGIYTAIYKDWFDAVASPKAP